MLQGNGSRGIPADSCSGGGGEIAGAGVVRIRWRVHSLVADVKTIRSSTIISSSSALADCCLFVGGHWSVTGQLAGGREQVAMAEAVSRLTCRLRLNPVIYIL